MNMEIVLSTDGYIHVHCMYTGSDISCLRNIPDIALQSIYKTPVLPHFGTESITFFHQVCQKLLSGECYCNVLTGNELKFVVTNGTVT